MNLNSGLRTGFVVAALTSLLSACGGAEGGADGTRTAVKPNTPARESNTPLPPSSPVPASAPPAAEATPVEATPVEEVASVVIENTASVAQTNAPLTFGQVFAAGDMPSTASLSGVRRDGTAVALQMDVKATHADGSVRHAVVSGVIPALAANEAQTLMLSRGGAASSGTPPTAQALVAAGFTAQASIDLAGQTYRASAEEFLRSGDYTTWLSGPVATEWLIVAPLKTVSGTTHPHLTARFAVRSYAGLDQAKVDVIVENNWAYVPAPQNFTYDVTVSVGGSPVFSQRALTHFHHARWRKTFWWGAEPQLHVRHDPAYLMATKAIPNYDPAVVVSEASLAGLDSRWASATKQPMGPGIVLPAMPTAGGRADIGPLPQWTAAYVLSMDRRAKAVTLGTSDLAGSWPIHYRDKVTDLPISVEDFPYMTLLGRPGDTVNPATRRSEAFPACGGTCSTAPYNYQPDSSHQPSLAFVPYLVTGDHFHLEELHFWANYNVVQANPYYRGFDKGLLYWDQVRGQAWSLRTLGHAAYITPDDHPLKRYFSDLVANNMDWYNTTYTNAHPNQLGVIDGSGRYAHMPMAYNTPAGLRTGLAPWMDDFFTWSAGHLSELDFAGARELLVWKAKFPVGRMTAPGYCWVDGAVYALTVRPNATAPLYATLAEAYQATMRGVDVNGTAIPLVNSTGARYLDQACGSQAQADWRTQADLDARVARGPWRAGEMTGYASSIAGFPSNMQPALAVAATSGIPGATDAWTVFANRSVKPDYNVAPQWAIVPRP